MYVLVTCGGINKNEYKNDKDDLNIKKKLRGAYSYKYPIYNPYAIFISREVVDKSKFRSSSFGKNRKRIYLYSYNSDSIIKSELFITFISDSLINHRSANQLSSEGHIVSQKLTLSETSRRKWDVLSYIRTSGRNATSIEVRAVDEIRYEYKYDNMDRLTQASIYRNETLAWQEDYAYQDSLERTYRVDGFVNCSPSSNEYYSRYNRIWYNEHGDPTKSENYKDIDPILIRTRFYEYIYDEKNNWIQCDMYLEGSVEKTDEPTITHYRKIKYYEN